jgi:DNA-binding XRE family transcriptional regulator
MNAGTELQFIVGADGKPAFVVVPYEQFRRVKGGFTRGTVPNEVVNRSFDRGVSPMAAWREHLGITQAEVAGRIGITQAEVAGRIGITQAAYAQMERAKQPRKATLEKLAEAMGLEMEQLHW